MMAVLAPEIAPVRVELAPRDRAGVIATTPGDGPRTTRRFGLRVADESHQCMIGAETDEHVDMIGEHGLCEHAHVVTFG